MKVLQSLAVLAFGGLLLAGCGPKSDEPDPAAADPAAADQTMAPPPASPTDMPPPTDTAPDRAPPRLRPKSPSRSPHRPRTADRGIRVITAAMRMAHGRARRCLTEPADAHAKTQGVEVGVDVARDVVRAHVEITVPGEAKREVLAQAVLRADSDHGIAVLR